MANKKEKLKPGDIIVGMADVNNPTYFEMREITKAYAGKDLALTVQRSDANGVTKRLTVTVVPKKDSDTGRVVIGLGVDLDVEHPVVAKTIPTERYPQPIAIPRGATITAVDGVAVSNFYDVARELKKNAVSGLRLTGGSMTRQRAMWQSTLAACRILSRAGFIRAAGAVRGDGAAV